MKVVIFCGGLGVRMGEATQRIPKPMIPIGTRPILWHIMKWYASWGHSDFVLCLGYQAETIKDYFLNYQEALGNDFVLLNGGRDIQLLGQDIESWTITFVDTGMHTTIGQRLKRVERHIGDDRGLPCDVRRRAHRRSAGRHDRNAGRERGHRAVHLGTSAGEYHVVRADDSGVVQSIDPLGSADVWINGGFFVFRRRIFDVIEPGEELVDQPLARLIERGELHTYRYEGFWEPMDTIKDKQKLDALLESSHAPWLVTSARSAR